MVYQETQAQSSLSSPARAYPDPLERLLIEIESLIYVVVYRVWLRMMSIVSSRADWVLGGCKSFAEVIKISEKTWKGVGCTLRRTTSVRVVVRRK